MAVGALVGAARVVMGVDDAQYRRDLSRSRSDFRRTTSGMQSDANSFAKSARRSFGFAAAGLIGAGSLGMAARMAFTEFAEGQKVAAQTNAVLKSTGGVARVSARDVGILGDAIARKTGIDDEQVKSAENVLLTFTKVRNEIGRGNNVFSQATGVIVDMSVALDQDLKSSAIQVGKALNDPIKGLTALQRVGVSFTAQQKEMIKSLVEQGRTLEAQKIIVKELATEFGGSGAARGNTLAGQMAGLKNEAAELGATFAGMLAPALRSTVTWLRTQVDAFQKNKKAQAELRDTAIEVASAVKGIARAANTVSHAFGGWIPTIKLVVGLLAVRKLLAISAAIRGIGTASIVSAGQMNALAAAEGRVAAGAVGLGAVGGLAAGLGASAAFGVGAAGAGVEQRNPQKVVEKNGRYYLDYGNNTLIEISASQAAAFKADNPTKYAGKTGAGATFGITPLAPAKTVKRGSAGGGSGDGLSALQRLQLADSRAQTTEGLSDDLAAGKGLLAYYAGVVKNGKLTGDKLFAAKQDYLGQLQRVNAIQDQIGQAASDAADKRHAKIEKQQADAKRKEDAFQARIAKIAAANIRSRANLVYDPASGFFKQTKPGAGSKRTASGAADKARTAAELEQFFKDQLGSFFGSFAPNVFTPGADGSRMVGTLPGLTVNVHTNAPATPSLAREVMYGAQAARRYFDG